MGDLRSYQVFVAALDAALNKPAVPARNIDEFCHAFEIALSREVGPTKLSLNATRRRQVLHGGPDPIIPKPLPDEILHSWRGRVATLNVLTNTGHVEALLRAQAARSGVELSDDPDFIECAAVALGMDRNELVRHHALLPFFSVLTDLKQNKPGTKSAKHLRAWQRKEPFRVDGRHALFCRQCAEEDLKAKRPSYWRRSHHLPGVLSCSKHGTPLILAGGHECFDSCPHHFIGDVELIQCELPRDERARSILQRYGEIAAEILDSMPSIDSETVSRKFGKRASAVGLRISRSGRRQTPSSQIIDTLPLDWLRNTFPRVRWSHGKYISTFDGACSPRATRYTTATFCLLAAVLYDDASVALGELLDRTSDVDRKEPLGFDFWASREVLGLYAACGGIASKVAHEMGIPSSSVSLGLLTQGLPGLGRTPGVRQALRAYGAGVRLDEACRRANVSFSLVDDLMRAAGARLFLALELMPDESTDMNLRAA